MVRVTSLSAAVGGLPLSPQPADLYEIRAEGGHPRRLTAKRGPRRSIVLPGKQDRSGESLAIGDFKDIPVR